VTTSVQVWLCALYVVSIAPLLAAVLYYHRKDQAALRAPSASK
jgi:hypothetical protein